MVKFWHVVRLVFLERMAYRTNLFLEVFGGILASVIVVVLWKAIFQGAGTNQVGGYSLPEMVTYLLGAGLINSFILTTAEHPEASEAIQGGDLSGILIRPMNPHLFWFARDLGNKGFYLLLGFAGYLAVLVLFRDLLLPPPGPGHLLLFLVSVGLAAVVQFFVFQVLGLLSFWMENTYGIRFTARVVMEVVAGAIIPLSFFPRILHDLFLLLPFPLMIYLPMRIYLGKISLEHVPFELLKGVLWIVILVLLYRQLWVKGMQQYVSMGD
ncbi:MAG TPA: ABC-2 family transporter protein [Candidatus Limnocylindrales bacterium]|nr:ABC-2 family transporter protein [Candidatus Limnocylindrales bacterium]